MSRHVPVNAVNTVDAVESPEYYKYWAFISYSHRDERWARWLHHALETYRIPKRLNFPTSTRGGGPANDRIYPVFRDRDELSGGFDLSERITAALKQSRFLIVICSPSASKSRHVCDEIDTFESLGREHRVLCFIVDGEPGASSRLGPRQPSAFLLRCVRGERATARSCPANQSPRTFAKARTVARTRS